MSDFSRIVSIVRFPYGRWAAENGEGTGDLTRADLHEIARAFVTWHEVHRQLAVQRQDEEGTPRPEAGGPGGAPLNDGS